MSSPATPSPTKISTPTAPMKVVKEKKEKAVKEKVVKEKVAKKEKAAPIDEVVPVVEEVKEKKARAPTLPAKYSKFIQYSYYLIRALNNKSLETDGEVLVDEDKFFDMAQVFADMGTQQEFVSSFLENKTIAKDMRTHIADQKKAAVKATKDAAKAAVKATKDAEKEAAKSAKEAAKAIEKEAAKAAKATKATKAKAKASKKPDVPDLVTSLVTLANATTDANILVDVPAEEEEELDVQIFTHDSKTYLIDDNNTLYDNETHLVIGTWDKENLTIIIA